MLDHLVGSARYNVHDNRSAGYEPTLKELSNYDQVIWFSGNAEVGSAGPDASGESALSDWLDGQGRLLVSSQDYFSDRGLTSLISGYLGVGSASSDVANTLVTGQGSIFGILGPYSLAYAFENRSDQIDPNIISEVAFGGNHGNAAVYKDGGDYRTSFMAFPWEAVPSENDRQVTLAAFLSWCDPGAVPSIELLPSALSSTMLPNATSTEEFDTGNNGDGLLIWQVAEDLNGDCTSTEDIPWCEHYSDNGATAPGSTSQVGVTYNSDGMGAGTHSASLCVANNDDLSPIVEIQLDMNVEQLAVFLPVLSN